MSPDKELLILLAAVVDGMLEGQLVLSRQVPDRNLEGEARIVQIRDDLDRLRQEVEKDG